MSIYYPEATASNGCVVTKALGAAYYEDDYSLHYLSIAGPANACEAIRASLQKNNNAYLGSLMPWATHYLNAPEKMVYETVRLPGSAESHMILWDKDPAAIVIADPAYLLARHQPDSPERQQAINELATRAHQTMHRMAADRLNAITQTPVLPEWIDTILNRLPEYDAAYAVRQLTCKGDAICGIALRKRYDWKKHICDLMRCGYIQIPTPAALAG